MKPIPAFLIILCLFIVNVSSAQEKKHSKKTVLKVLVIDTERNPIQNASVFVDGKNYKVLSDVDGRLELKFKSKVKRITVYTTLQGATDITYQGQEEITFVLPSSSDLLADSLSKPMMKETDDMNAYYIKAHAQNLKKHFGKVDQNSVKNNDSYRTIYEMIQGTVAGVNVRGNSITIRGVASFTLSTEPLFIVNSIPVSTIDHISPNNVKSIQVLKGSDAAIYGVRGANGVIVIDLKTFEKK